MLLFFFFIYI